MNAAWVVFGKEWLDAIRDKRSLLSALIFPLVMPVLVALMLTALVPSGRGTGFTRVGVVGAERAPTLAAYLEDNNWYLVPVGGDLAAARTAVRSKVVDAVLVIPEEFAVTLREGRPAPVELVFDGSSRQPGVMMDLRQQLGVYSSQLASLRLLARGLDPQLVSVLAVRDEDVSSYEDRAGTVLLMVPFFLILAAFMGGMHVAIDVTAGERERGSFEPLLLNPVPRLSIVLGKWGVAACFAVGSALLTAAGTLVALWLAPLEEVGVRIAIYGSTVGGLLLGLVPLAFLSSALQMLVASFARSFREAQTYVALMLLLPMLPSLWFLMEPMDLGDWSFLIPVLGQVQLLADAVGGKALDGAHVAQATNSALALTALALIGTRALVGNETTVIGG